MNQSFISSLGLVLLSGLIGATTIEEDFANPPVKARPYVWWHWMGPNFSKTGITKDLEAMKETGIGGATIFNITSGVSESNKPIGNTPWPEQTYRSPAYWEAIAHAAAEAARLGLEIGLHNTVGYSTTGGPWINQERGMQRLCWSETRVEAGAVNLSLPQPKIPAYRGWGGSIKEAITFYRDIAVLAVPAEGALTADRVVDLSSKMDASGKLFWNAPEGVWKIYRFGHVPTGATPHPVPDDVLGLALEVDKMSAEQTRFHWEQVLNPLKQHVGAYLGKSFGHVLIDSYEAGAQNWTPGIREAFVKMKGYDPVPWLVSMGQVLTGDKENKARRLIRSEAETARFEFDYKEVVAELYRVNGWETGASLIRAAGLTLQFEPYGGPFDTIAGSSLADLPMGEFWNPGKGGINGNIVAAARAAGRNVIGAEAFTSRPQNSRWSETPAGLKISGDGTYGSGANRLVLHHWVHQPFDDRYKPGSGMGWWGTHFSRHQTWSEPGKACFAYLGRTQALLQRGEPTVQVLSVGQTAGFSDVIPQHVFLRDLKVEDGKVVVVPSGRRYPILVVPHKGLLLPAVVRRIGELLQAGAIIVSPRPQSSPSLQDYPRCDAEVAKLANEIWGETSERSKAVGKGKLYGTGDLKLALGDLGLQQSTWSVTGENTNFIRVAQRRDAQTEIFFVASIQEDPANITLSCRVSGLQPELWNAEDGSRRLAPNWRQKEGCTEVDLSLGRADSVFVVFRQPSTGSCASSAAPVTVFSLPVGGSWEVAFGSGMGAPAKINFPSLLSWSQHADPAIKYFSGTATYRKTLKIAPEQLRAGRQLRLDLGNVCDLADVRLNGKPVRVLWRAPYAVEITAAAKPGDNQLEIAVTNTWHNRLIGDEQEPAELTWGPVRKFGGEVVGAQLEAFPDWFVKNQPRPSPGRKAFVTWNYFTKESPLIDAGLLGPVTLAVLETPQQ